jgi:hypothetical protein
MEVLMTTNFRDPRQVKQLDDVTLRREMKRLLPGELILDSEEWDELLDFSNQGARLNFIRKNVIAARRNGGQQPRMLDPSERNALAAYVLNGGPRPRFARFASPDGHYGASYLAPDDPDAATPAPPWPEQDPDEPGRYVQPKGDYAIPSDQR